MTSERFDTYGFPAPDLEAARRFTEARLGVRLHKRDSGYRGEYYALSLPADGDVQLYRNEFRGRPQRSEYADYGVLLELSRLPEMDAVRERLLAEPSPAVPLRSRTIEVAADPD